MFFPLLHPSPASRSSVRKWLLCIWYCFFFLRTWNKLLPGAVHFSYCRHFFCLLPPPCSKNVLLLLVPTLTWKYRHFQASSPPLSATACFFLSAYFFSRSLTLYDDSCWLLLMTYVLWCVGLYLWVPEKKFSVWFFFSFLIYFLKPAVTWRVCEANVSASLFPSYQKMYCDHNSKSAVKSSRLSIWWYIFPMVEVALKYSLMPLGTLGLIHFLHSFQSMYGF